MAPAGHDELFESEMIQPFSGVASVSCYALSEAYDFSGNAIEDNV
jgi:hypothetical protein